MNKKRDIILLYLEQDGKRLTFYVGENGKGYIPVLFTMASALEFAEIVRKKFEIILGFAFLKGASIDGLESNYTKDFPHGLEYTFVYEGTPEFKALEKKLR